MHLTPPTAALLALVGFATAVYWIRRGKPSGIDHQATMVFQRIENPWFYRVMVLVSLLGYPPAIVLIPALVASVLWLAEKRVDSLFTLASGGAAALAVLVKREVGRPRPAGNGIRVAMKLPDYAFPSGHTAYFVSFFGFMAYLAARCLRPASLGRFVVGLLVLLIGLVGPSRVYLGQHWLSDVLAAYLLGFAYLIGLTEAYQKIKSLSEARAGKKMSPSRGER